MQGNDNILQVIRFAKTCESEAKLKAMASLARTEDGIPIRYSDLDANNYKLNCENGTIDLKLGKLFPHSREDLNTKIIPVKFDPTSKAPTWEAFLRTITSDNNTIINYLQRIIGYSLTGITSEQCLFILYGIGANGKSTFLETIKYLLADYSITADFTTLLANQNGKIRNDIARLKGSRFVTAVEGDENCLLSESVVKQLTGNDTITARFLYQEAFEFRPTFKIFLATNHKPTIKGQDHAIWRRIKLIPFEVTIPTEKRDPKLLDKLKEELSGILNWALEGCLDYQKYGLQEPKEVSIATEAYQSEMDIIENFIEDCCSKSPEVKATSAKLFEAYKTWAKDNNIRPETKKWFGNKLIQKGFEQTRVGNMGSRGYKGLTIADNSDTY